VVRALSETFRSRPAEDWLTRLRERGVPSGKVRGVHEAFEAAALAGRAATVVTEHPTIGALSLTASPIELDPPLPGTPSAPPLLGQHTEEVLRELGLDPAELIGSGVASGPGPSGSLRT
jgi:crotonobetainyl-CoA:carnitine CoA-transferase CaiB-like acyl-CoA transferase